MSKDPDPVALSDLRRNAKRYVRKVREGAGPFAITRRGEWVAVLLSAAQFAELVNRGMRKTKAPAKASANGKAKPKRKKAVA